MILSTPPSRKGALLPGIGQKRQERSACGLNWPHPIPSTIVYVRTRGNPRGIQGNWGMILVKIQLRRLSVITPNPKKTSAGGAPRWNNLAAWGSRAEDKSGSGQDKRSNCRRGARSDYERRRPP